MHLLGNSKAKKVDTDLASAMKFCVHAQDCSFPPRLPPPQAHTESLYIVVISCKCVFSLFF